jgi:hypothetical protein
MNIVVGQKSFSKKQVQRNSIEKYGVIAFLFIIFVVLIKYSVFPLVKDQAWLNVNFWVVTILLTIGFVFCLAEQKLIKTFDLFLDNKNNKIGRGKAGDEGETMVLNELKRILKSDDYTVYPNYKINGRRSDFDFLIVGPKGLIVMEVKNLSDKIHIHGDRIERVKEEKYEKNVKILKGKADFRKKLDDICKFLKKELGFRDVTIKKVLVFPGGGVSLMVDRPGIYIVQKIEELARYFENLQEDKKFTPDFCKDLNDKLKNLR